MRRFYALLWLTVAGLALVGCDVGNIFSDTIIVAPSQVDTPGAGASPTPAPAGGCILGGIGIAPIAGTTDENVTAPATVVFQVTLLDTNEPQRPVSPTCASAFPITTSVSASPAGACDAVAKDSPQPSVRANAPGSCSLTASAGEHVGSFTLSIQ